MRFLVIAVTSLIFISSFSFGQTEAWRLPGHYFSATHGDNGSLFLAHDNYLFMPYTLPDTIKKSIRPVS
ncbi:MAG: hypothetical protein HZB59_01075 [Ignavibacteriales bacterium]|nr:hypothetical protein [Ignavibacteriales bacterium]